VRRLPATGLIALLGCTVPSQLELGGPPQDGPSKTGEAAEPVPRPWPEPPREPIDFPRGEPIIEVVQFPYLGSAPSKWTFAPQGHWVAEPAFGGCDIWDIETGFRLGEWTDPKVDPCKQWPSPHVALGLSVEPSSYDSAFTATIAKANLEILANGTQVRTLECRRCAEVRAFDWEPRGHRLAVVREGGALEIWDADSGTRRATLSKRAPLGKDEHLDSMRVAWSPLGVLVSYDFKREMMGSNKPDGAHWGFDWYTQVQIWSESGKLLHEFLSGDTMNFVLIDPAQQWLFVISDHPKPQYEYGESLNVYSLVGKSSALAWEDFDRTTEETTEYLSSGGHWRVDASTTWLADYAEEVFHEGEWAYGLAVLQAEPTPSFARIELLRDDEDELDHEKVSMRPYGHHAGTSVLDWSYEGVNGGRIEHRAFEPSIPDCELVDVSPDLAIELLRCAAEMRVRSRGQTRGLGLAPDSRWIWGRSGWLAVEHGGHLVVLDAGLQILVDRRDSALLDAALANTHDLLGLRSAEAFELFAPLTNSSSLRDEHVVVDAALSPDGKRVATLGNETVRIFAVDDGTLLVRFDEPNAKHLAFAQDGRLLFTGTNDAPERAWNSWTGESVPDGVVTVPDGTLDPTWRWSIVGHDRVVRMLDGLALNLGPNWAMLHDGRFVGTPPREHTRDRTYRIGEALAVPNCSFTDLEPRLHRPQLLEDFFAGRPIAPAVVPFDEVARTNCTLSAKPRPY
jgi:WD40 repeat protein